MATGGRVKFSCLHRYSVRLRVERCSSLGVIILGREY